MLRPVFAGPAKNLMTAPSFILITSIIVRIGEGGLTEVQPFATLDACFQSKLSLDVELKGKVAALDNRCEETTPKPIFNLLPAVETPPTIVTPKVKPADPVGDRAVRHRAMQEPAPLSAWAKNCLYRKYRLVNGVRRWYCKRRKGPQ